MSLSNRIGTCVPQRLFHRIAVSNAELGAAFANG